MKRKIVMNKMTTSSSTSITTNCPKATTTTSGTGISTSKILAHIEYTFESLPRHIQFTILVSAVFISFGINGILQETIMSLDGFHFGVMLGYCEVLGYVFAKTLCLLVYFYCVFFWFA